MLLLGILANSSMLFGQTERTMVKTTDRQHSNSTISIYTGSSQKTLVKFIEDEQTDWRTIWNLTDLSYRTLRLKFCSVRKNILATWTEKFPSGKRFSMAVESPAISMNPRVDISFKIDALKVPLQLRKTPTSRRSNN
jgi:predicted GTPase